MSLQYISDNSGNHTAIIIPINEWNEITAKHEDLKALTPTDNSIAQGKRKPSEFAGSVPQEVAKTILKDIEQSRKEWERNF